MSFNFISSKTIVKCYIQKAYESVKQKVYLSVKFLGKAPTS